MSLHLDEQKLSDNDIPVLQEVVAEAAVAKLYAVGIAGVAAGAVNEGNHSSLNDEKDCSQFESSRPGIVR